MKNEEEIVWIIRYDNGNIGCFYGTKQDAEAYATREAEKKETGYYIV